MILSGPLVAWRERRRAERRAAERAAHLAAADVVLLSLGKSGRTWLAAMLSHVLHRRYGAPVDDLIKSPRFYRGRESMPRFYVTHGIRGDPFSRAGPRHPSELLEGKRLLFLIRDPRDVAVSLYYQATRRSARAEEMRAKLGDDLFLALTRVPGGLLHGAVRGLAAWERETATGVARQILRYEDLHEAPEATLAAALEFCGVPCDAEDVAAAVAFAAFDSLQAKERAGFFRTRALRPGRPDDPDSFKVRRGRVGGYRDHFTAEQCAELDRIVARGLPPRLGYGEARV
jgi:alcohol sulfotransferase